LGYAKTQQEAIYQVNLKHKLRAMGVGGWKNYSSTKKLEKILKG